MAREREKEEGGKGGRNFIVSLCKTKRAVTFRRFSSSSSSFLGLPHPSVLPVRPCPSSFLLGFSPSLCSFVSPTRGRAPRPQARFEPSQSELKPASRCAGRILCIPRFFSSSSSITTRRPPPAPRALRPSFPPPSSLTLPLSSSYLKERVCNRAFSTKIYEGFLRGIITGNRVFSYRCTPLTIAISGAKRDTERDFFLESRRRGSLHVLDKTPTCVINF